MKQYKNVLVLAVGGGNDSVSTLLLQLELNKKFNYKPDNIDIVAVLPDCLEYHNLLDTEHSLVSVITPHSTRSVGDKAINSFPEKVLSQNKNYFNKLNINKVYGISMNKGSIGISNSLKFLLKNNYDLVLAIDVGGDFIAHKENIEVLSPMMDGYMLYSLKQLQNYIQSENINTDILFSIFGLGTDGESTPKMLKKAISLVPNIKEYQFDKEISKFFSQFYYDIVEKNRYSRTTDFTIKEILGIGHENPTLFRGRFHTKPVKNSKSNIYYGNFQHTQSENYYGKYYLFKDISKVENIYSKKSNNGIEWFLNVQKQDTKINHELNGQSYLNIGSILNIEELKNKSLFFGTPSRKFNEEQQKEIIKDINQMILNDINDFAIIYKEYLHLIDNNIYTSIINSDLVLISKNRTLLDLFSKLLSLY